MNTKLAYIVEIEDVLPFGYTIDLVLFNNKLIMVNHGDFEIGQPCVYIEPGCKVKPIYPFTTMDKIVQANYIIPSDNIISIPIYYKDVYCKRGKLCGGLLLSFDEFIDDEIEPQWLKKYCDRNITNERIELCDLTKELCDLSFINKHNTLFYKIKNKMIEKNKRKEELKRKRKPPTPPSHKEATKKERIEKKRKKYKKVDE